MSEGLYGVVAEFTTPEALVQAARAARDRGYSNMETYTPFAVPELDDVIVYRNWLPLIVLIGGASGTITGYVLQTYIAVFDYPLNIGGRPLHSWPSFIIVMFELTILFASLAAFFGMLFLNGLPAPYHPTGNAPGFDNASQDRFFLCIEARDKRFDHTDARDFLHELGPEKVEDVRY